MKQIIWFEINLAQLSIFFKKKLINLNSFNYEFNRHVLSLSRVKLFTMIFKIIIDSSSFVHVLRKEII